MNPIFISHSTTDDNFVRDLCHRLQLHQHDAWIDSRELLPGDLLHPEIEQALDSSKVCIVVITAESAAKPWVQKETAYAQKLKAERGHHQYLLIPLLLNDTDPKILHALIPEEHLYIPVNTTAHGLDAAMPTILAALNRTPRPDLPPESQPPQHPLEELILELSDLKIEDNGLTQRASARARLVYEPAAADKAKLHSKATWRFTAPLGPIETDDLRWYLQTYAIWPGEIFRERAHNIEADLVKWGQQLYQAALPLAHTSKVLTAWATINPHAKRRFSIYLNNDLEADAPNAHQQAAKTAAAQLLALPWELLHDGTGYLFQGRPPTRVRRRLPNTNTPHTPLVNPPIRILLISARPEDASCGYIDHRASALPLVEAMEKLGGLVALHILHPATLPALRQALADADQRGQPYHVVHFNGHGVFNPAIGLGGLCFENPQDKDKLEKRRAETVYTDKLGPLLRGHRIPLVFLEACQTATADATSESVATELLKAGVASVVAMSHSVLVKTASLFVTEFYQALAKGQRIGDAMLAGQQYLYDHPHRQHSFGQYDLQLQDWFVPVLFQEKADPQLFTALPNSQTRACYQQSLTARLGVLPPPPATQFIGRSRELLSLERQLQHQPYAVIRGQGGEGKTTLAVELARWLVRTEQTQRVAFVSVETHGNLNAVLDALGKQLVNTQYSSATSAKLPEKLAPILRALQEHACLLLLDNMESILPPLYLKLPEAIAAQNQAELHELLTVCQQLQHIPRTRLLFTSREPLPPPYAQNHLELHSLHPEDAIQLVAHALQHSRLSASDAAKAEQQAIAELVNAVHCHARTLALLAPSLSELGVEKTHANLSRLMADMQQKFPNSREHSLYASLELSLQRMSIENREKAKVLGLFHGGVQPAVLVLMMDWPEVEVNTLAAELVNTGLATPEAYNHLSLNPALCPYLQAQLTATERQSLLPRWQAAMLEYVNFLYQQQTQNPAGAASLTLLELGNLFVLLDLSQQTEAAEQTLDLTDSLFRLLQNLGKPQLLSKVVAVNAAAQTALGDNWSHAAFQAEFNRIQQLYQNSQLPTAWQAMQALLAKLQSAGVQAYPDVDYDTALAYFLAGRILRTAGQPETALGLIDEAKRGFEKLAGKAAENMSAVCIVERADCLTALGKLEEAANAYQTGISLAEQLGDTRQVATNKCQFGTVRLRQKQYAEALQAYQEARDTFTQLNEPGSVATCWHQTGMTYQHAGQPEAAETAYLQALAIVVQLSDEYAPAKTLNQLGIVYADELNRPEQAVSMYRQAVAITVKFGDQDKEGRTRNNLAKTLCNLQRYPEARQEIQRALTCKAQFGHAAVPWTTWNILADIETAADNPTAATAARQNAIECYLAYRRDGGENHNTEGRIALALIKTLHQQGPAASAAFLLKLHDDPNNAPGVSYLQALQNLLTGNRAAALAATENLYYSEAAEILLLLETLPTPKSPNPLSQAAQKLRKLRRNPQ